MTSHTKILPISEGMIRLLTRKEIADLLRVSARTVEELTKRWETSNQHELEPLPSSPRCGLRPTRVTAKMILYDMRDIQEYLRNARLEQEGQPPARFVEVGP